jgi:hypothetical protein
MGDAINIDVILTSSISPEGDKIGLSEYEAAEDCFGA